MVVRICDGPVSIELRFFLQLPRHILISVGSWDSAAHSALFY